MTPRDPTTSSGALRTGRATILATSLMLFGCGTGCGANGASSATTQPSTARAPDPVEIEGPTAPPPGRTHTPPPRRRPVGTNLAPPSYWGGAFPFVDLMKHSDGWISGSEGTWNDGRSFETDPHGWLRRLAPGRIARVFILGGEHWHPTGRFTVLYEGRGTIEYRGRVEALRREPGHDTFVLAGTDGLYLEITAVDANDPLRNIRVIAPGGRCDDDVTSYCTADAGCAGRCVPFTENYAEQPFHPTFLEETQAFSVVRFMDWQNTNRERTLDDADELPSPRRWSDLPTRESMSWRPVPVDVMVDLANQLGVDPWFAMPHTAEDELVATFASRVAARLASDRKVYVEYTNEYWNDIFDQHQWINGEGCRRHSRNPGRDCDPDGNGTLCEYTSWNATQERCLDFGRRYYAERTVEIGRIWREAFRNATPERVRRVMAGQIGGADWWMPEYLERQVDGSPAHTQVDVMAVAPYFGGGERRERSVDEIFRRIPNRRRDGAPENFFEILVGPADAPYGDVFHWIQKDVAALRARAPNVEYVAYEGGQHLHSHDEAQMAMFTRANRDPRMEELYFQYLTMWRVLTDDALFVHFRSPSTWGAFGTWGSKERQGQPLAEAPKHRALLRYIETE